MNTKDAAIRIKLAKAKALIREVPMLIQFKYHSTAITRMYYSYFHATKALLLTIDVIPKTHSGVIRMLHQHFVTKGGFDKNYADFFSKLMQERIEIDYDDNLPFERDDIDEYYELAKNTLPILNH
jgi:uncharacterized protein (UPF0332 family)